MDTGSVLRAAAARVRQGWCQRLMRDEKDNVCVRSELLIYLHRQANTMMLILLWSTHWIAAR